MKKRTEITESLYKAIKMLIESGATYTEVYDYYNVSTSTCKRIKDTKDFKDYRNQLAAIALEKKAKYANKKATQGKQPEEKQAAQPQRKDYQQPQVVEHRSSVTIQATHYMMQEMQETNKLLKEISAKLAFLVEQLA